MALSGTISETYRGWTLESRWSATQNIGGNYSDITVEHYLVQASGYSLNISSRTNTCTVNGVSQDFTSGAISGSGTKYLGTTTYRVAHNADGTKSCSLKTVFNIKATLSGTYVASITASDTITLNTIPRSATATSATNFNDTGNPVFEYSNPAGSAVTTLQACIAGTDGTTIYVPYRDISKSGTSYTFNLTDAERNALRAATPNSNTLSVRFYVKTVLGGNTYYSYATATMTIVNANPTFSASYKDTKSSVTAITGNNQKIVRNQSTLQISVTSLSAKKYATISSVVCTLNGTNYNGTVSGTSCTFNIGTVNISSNTTATLKVTDSRGNTATRDLNITILDWVLPTAITTMERENNFYSNTTITVDGSISSVDGLNTMTIKVRYKKTTDSTWSSYTTMQDNVSQVFSLDNEYAWNVQVVISDLFGSTTYNLTLSRGMPIIFFDRLKSSTGFNCFPQYEQSVEVNGISMVKSIITRTLSADATNLTANSYTKINLNTQTTLGANLSVTSDGGIKIGAGVSKVLVSGRVAFQAGDTTGLRHARICKNYTSTDDTLAWTYISIEANYHGTAAMTPTLVDVEEDDVIYLFYHTANSGDKIGGNTYGGRTSLTVEAVA